MNSLRHSWRLLGTWIMKDLYRDVIVDHNRHPRNFGALDPADAKADGHNPLCGDRLTSTSICRERPSRMRSSMDRLCHLSRFRVHVQEAVKGKSRADVKALFDQVHALLTRQDHR